jgi:hypothetical protein
VVVVVVVRGWWWLVVVVAVVVVVVWMPGLAGSCGQRGAHPQLLASACQA